MGLAAWWWISEAALHPFSCREVQWALASAHNDHQKAFQGWHDGLWPYPWEQAAHKPHSHIWHEVSHCPASCWVSPFLTNNPCGLFLQQDASVQGLSREWIHFFLLWGDISRSGRSCAGSGAARESQGKSVLSSRAMNCSQCLWEQTIY